MSTEPIEADLGDWIEVRLVGWINSMSMTTGATTDLLTIWVPDPDKEPDFHGFGGGQTIRIRPEDVVRLVQEKIGGEKRHPRRIERTEKKATAS